MSAALPPSADIDNIDTEQIKTVSLMLIILQGKTN